MKYGFVKVAASSPELKVADCRHNTEKILDQIALAGKQQVEILCFPALCLTSATAGDLFFQNRLLEAAENSLAEILEKTRGISTLCLLSLPYRLANQLIILSVAIQQGKMLAVFPQMTLPATMSRWFHAPSVWPENIRLCGQDMPFRRFQLLRCGEVLASVENGLDATSFQGGHRPLCLAGATLILNPCAEPERFGGYRAWREQYTQLSHLNVCTYVCASPSSGESTSDEVYGGRRLIAEAGECLAQVRSFEADGGLCIAETDVESLLALRRCDTRFSASEAASDTIHYIDFQLDKEYWKLTRTFARDPFAPKEEYREEGLQEIFDIQVSGLAKRIRHIGMAQPVIGISGGLDSTLALLVAVKAADRLGMERSKVIGITMPGFGTTSRTKSNAQRLMEELGVTSLEINIKDACIQHFSDIGHDIGNHNVVYENSQARERTQILMDYANKCNGLVVGTGDISELALGWATFNGDHMAMYGVNAGLTKSLVRKVVEFIAGKETEAVGKLLTDILMTPVSPELLPASQDGTISQKTEELVGPYELHDFFLYYFLRFGFSPEKMEALAIHTFIDSYDRETIHYWLKTFIRRFFNQQFKRSCMPDAPAVGLLSLSPRGAWSMPDDAMSASWLESI